MKPLSPCSRRRLEAEGFEGIPDDMLARLTPWLRLSSSMTAAWVLVGTLMASPAVLFALLPVLLLGAVSRIHPFDVPYDRWIRHLVDGPSLPPAAAPRRFVSAGSALWVFVTGVAFGTGGEVVGYLLGGLYLVFATINAVTGWCVMAYVYRAIYGPVTTYRLD